MLKVYIQTTDILGQLQKKITSQIASYDILKRYIDQYGD